jgi:hypothetical protein
MEVACLIFGVRPLNKKTLGPSSRRQCSRGGSSIQSSTEIEHPRFPVLTREYLDPIAVIALLVYWSTDHQELDLDEWFGFYSYATFACPVLQGEFKDRTNVYVMCWLLCDL